MKNNNYDDELLEILLKKTAKDYIKAESKKLDSEEYPEREFSAKFNADMLKLQKKMSAKKRFRDAVRPASAVAAVFLVYCMARPDVAVAYKQRFVNVVKSVTGNYVQTTSFTANVEYPVEQFPRDWEQLYAPTELPSGYSVAGIKARGSYAYVITYTNSSDELEFVYYRTNEVSVTTNSEHQKTEYVRLKSGEGLYSTYGSKASLGWSDDGGYFELNGDGLSKRAYIAIAESVKRIK